MPSAEFGDGVVGDQLSFHDAICDLAVIPVVFRLLIHPTWKSGHVTLNGMKICPEKAKSYL